jgi:aspartate 1-decarboxylase
MLREVLHSKIHMATVTGAKPHYVGSITIDADLLEACGMRVNDKVLISNCRNGNRLETYIFRGKPGSGIIELNGAAAHLVEEGDKVIIMHFALMSDEQYAANRPTVLIMKDDNTIDRVMNYEPFGGAGS